MINSLGMVFFSKMLKAVLENGETLFQTRFKGSFLEISGFAMLRQFCLKFV